MKIKSKILIIVCLLSILLTVVIVPSFASGNISNQESSTLEYMRNYVLPLDISIPFTDSTHDTGAGLYLPKGNAIRYNRYSNYSNGYFPSVLLDSAFLNSLDFVDTSYGNFYRNAYLNLSGNGTVLDSHLSFDGLYQCYGNDIVWAINNLSQYNNDFDVAIEEFWEQNTLAVDRLQNASVSAWPSFYFDGVIDVQELDRNFSYYLPSTVSYLYPVPTTTLSSLNYSAEYIVNISYDSIDFVNGEYVYNREYGTYEINGSSHSSHSITPSYYDWYLSYRTSEYYERKFNMYSGEVTFNFYHIVMDLMSLPQNEDYIRNLTIRIEPSETTFTGYEYDNMYPYYFTDWCGQYPMYAFNFSYDNAGIIGADAIDSIRGSYDNWVATNARNISYVSLNNFNLVDWLGDTLGGVFDIDIVGNISLGDVLSVTIAVGFVMLVLKFFAGG